MNYIIERITTENYNRFEDMVHWRVNSAERTPVCTPVPETVKKELENKDFYVYAVEVDNRFVGWISLTYIPKIGIWGGHGHIFVDELWVQPDYRGRGLAKALMKKADKLKEKYNSTGIRLYVNVNNPTAKGLYEKCGYTEDGQAYFMEKTK